MTLSLFVTHGAVFLSLKTLGDIRERARARRRRSRVVAAAGAPSPSWRGRTSDATVRSTPAGSWCWPCSPQWHCSPVSTPTGAAARAGRSSAPRRRIALAVASLFVVLFPDVMPSSLDAAYSLTTTNAASTHKTLTIMTWVAAIFTPLVLLYQGWSIYVFRKRIGVHHIPADSPVVAAAEALAAEAAANTAP